MPAVVEVIPKFWRGVLPCLLTLRLPHLPILRHQYEFHLLSVSVVLLNTSSFSSPWQRAEIFIFYLSQF